MVQHKQTAPEITIDLITSHTPNLSPCRFMEALPSCTLQPTKPIKQTTLQHSRRSPTPTSAPTTPPETADKRPFTDYKLPPPPPSAVQQPAPAIFPSIELDLQYKQQPSSGLPTTPRHMATPPRIHGHAHRISPLLNASWPTYKPAHPLQTTRGTCTINSSPSGDCLQPPSTVRPRPPNTWPRPPNLPSTRMQVGPPIHQLTLSRKQEAPAIQQQPSRRFTHNHSQL